MSVNIDLNQSPPYLNLRSTVNIKIVVKKKENCRQVLVERYGEEAYNAIVASVEPLMLYHYASDHVCVFILVS